jgi:hypothetical protein
MDGSSTDPQPLGIACGTLFAMRRTGSVIGVALFGSLPASQFVSGVHVALAVERAVLVGGRSSGSRSPPIKTRHSMIRRAGVPEGVRLLLGCLRPAVVSRAERSWRRT